MSKQISIISADARARLAVRREPYWCVLRKGLAVGYRRVSEGEGTWIARQRDESTGRQQYQSLGHVETFEDAATAAREWADTEARGVVLLESVNVEQACKRYVARLRANKRDKTADDAEARFETHVYKAPVAKVALDKLTSVHISDWRDGLIKRAKSDDLEAIRRAKDTANRHLSSFKAAMNLAFKDGLYASDAAWRRVSAFRGVGKGRQGYLTVDQRRSLIVACATDLATFIKGLLHTASRPGELIKVRASDFNERQGTLQLSSALWIDSQLCARTRPYNNKHLST
ncbi:hypothetical protein OHZ10_11780 [Burkholderia arboris]|uniref:Integrase n=1 Tax=Burkholderia arboris TaxID=488730 RepID=A0ABZ3DDB3_9BURK